MKNDKLYRRNLFTSFLIKKLLKKFVRIFFDAQEYFSINCYSRMATLFLIYIRYYACGQDYAKLFLRILRG